ncbi:hypothetical protein RCL1_002222 [Eukaryota sp. TZLM3-RCL]
MESLLESPPSSKYNKKQNLLVTLLLVVLTVSIVSVFFAFVETRSLKYQIDEQVDSIRPLPRKFFTQYLTAITDQFHRGTCWSFATINTLESFYRRFGERSGFLKKGEYAKFSEQAYAIDIIDYCKKYPERCPDTDKSTDNADDGYIIWIWAFQNYLKNLILPDMETCPYVKEIKKPEDNLKCDGKAAAQKNNPISYSAKLVKTLYTVDDLKRALIKDKILPVVIELAWSKYYIPCEAKYADVTECKQKSIKCPADIASPSEFCFTMGIMTDDVGHFVLDKRTGHDAEHVGMF